MSINFEKTCDKNFNFVKYPDIKYDQIVIKNEEHMRLRYSNTDSGGADITRGWELKNRLSKDKCMEKCLADPACKVAMYGKKSNDNSFKGCWTKRDLNSRIQSARTSIVGKDDRFDVYVKEKPLKTQAEVEQECKTKANGRDFFYQRHKKNNHTICGFVKDGIKLSENKDKLLKHGHEFGAVCMSLKSKDEECDCDTVERKEVIEKDDELVIGKSEFGMPISHNIRVGGKKEINMQECKDEARKMGIPAVYYNTQTSTCNPYLAADNEAFINWFLQGGDKSSSPFVSIVIDP